MTVAPDIGSVEPSFDVLSVADHAARHWLCQVVAVQILRLSSRLGFSAMAANCAGRLVMGLTVEVWMVCGALICLLVASALSWLGDDQQARAEEQVTSAVRSAFLKQLSHLAARQIASGSTGGWVVAMQHYPEDLSALVIGHRSALLMMGLGPVLCAAALAVISWQAAILVLCLTPVMIVFFVLVGTAIRAKADAQAQALQKLAGQFADRIRTLPTILANHALTTEEAKLSERLELHAKKTLGVLSIAFINAGIIDFFSSLSIAILAVFLGLGHLHLIAIPGFSDLYLWQSLLILMIAPEYFAPFRRFSEQYHAKAQGAAAAVALNSLLRNETHLNSPPAALVDLDVDLPERGLVAIIGPSGCGKSTLLRQLVGINVVKKQATDRHVVGEKLHSLTEMDVAWVGADAFLPEGIMADIIGGNQGQRPGESRKDWAGKLGLLDEKRLPNGLDEHLSLGAATLSGGQRLRLIIARAAISGRVVVADEPTAKLDPRTAELVREALISIASDRLVVVATHDPILAALATQIIDLAVPQKEDAA